MQSIAEDKTAERTQLDWTTKPENKDESTLYGRAADFTYRKASDTVGRLGPPLS